MLTKKELIESLKKEFKLLADADETWNIDYGLDILRVRIDKIGSHLGELLTNFDNENSLQYNDVLGAIKLSYKELLEKINDISDWISQNRGIQSNINQKTNEENSLQNPILRTIEINATIPSNNKFGSQITQIELPEDLNYTITQLQKSILNLEQLIINNDPLNITRIFGGRANTF